MNPCKKCLLMTQYELTVTGAFMECLRLSWYLGGIGTLGGIKR